MGLSSGDFDQLDTQPKSLRLGGFGSFNFTKASEENNAENLLLIRDVKLAAQFEANWQRHFAHAEYDTGK